MYLCPRFINENQCSLKKEIKGADLVKVRARKVERKPVLFFDWHIDSFTIAVKLVIWRLFCTAARDQRVNWFTLLYTIITILHQMMAFVSKKRTKLLILYSFYIVAILSSPISYTVYVLSFFPRMVLMIHVIYLL